MTSTAAPTQERQILDALPIAICTVDLDGRLRFVNRSWGRFARATDASPPTATEGTTIWEAMSDVAPREQMERAFALLRDGRAQSLSWELHRGTPRDENVFQLQINRLYDGHVLSGFEVSAVDITEHHRWREALIESGLALSQPISMDRVLVEIASQLRRAVLADAVAIALTDQGADTVSLAYASGFEVDAPEVEAAMRPVWRDVMADGATITRDAFGGQETTVAIANGEVRGAISVVVARPTIVHPGRGETQRAIAVIAAQAGAALARARLVQRTSQKCRLDAIGEVAAGVAHELRNPLFGISSAAQLLRFRVRDDPVIEKNVGRLLREVDRLNGTVTSLLEYGSPAPIRLALRDPDEIWDDVLAVQRGLLESKALIVRRKPAHPRSRCNLDAEQMAQVFVNVLVNAVDAAPEGTDLTLTSAVHANGSWRCRLHNDGPPLSAEVLERAFEIFYSTKPGGTGFGLALCQRTVEEHGGSIALESTAEQGTILSIILPTARS